MNIFIILGFVGPWQLVIIIVAILFLFGGRKIPELMKGLGEGVKEFKKATKGDSEAQKDEQGDEKSIKE